MKNNIMKLKKMGGTETWLSHYSWNSQYLWLPAQDLHNIGPADKIARNEEGTEITISLSHWGVII